MKTKCNQCGKVFEVPDTQKNRALKCACKTIFIATPYLGKEGDRTGPAIENKVSFDEASLTTNESLEVDTSSLDDQTMDDYINFLKTSKVSKKPPELENIITHVKAQTPQEPKESEAPQSDLEPEDTCEETIASKMVTQTFDINLEPKKLEPPPDRQRPQPGARRPAPTLNPPKLSTHRLLVICGAAVTGIIIVLFAIFQEPEKKEETLDPYLQKLLTPTPAKQATPIEIKLPEAHTPKTPQPNEKYKPNLNSNPAPSNPLRSAMLEGDFENVVRVGSVSQKLNDEEKALFLEALFLRAGSERGRLNDLLSQLQSAKIDYPDSSALERTRAFSLIQDQNLLGHLARSVDILKSLSLTRPNDPFVYTYLGQAYMAMNQPTFAQQAWDQALKIEKNFPWLLRMREEYYRKSGDLAKALEAARSLSALDKHEVDGLKRVANLYLMQKKKADAVKAYKKALEFDEAPEVRLELSRALGEEDPEAAMSEINQALKAKLSSPIKRDLLIEKGKVYCSQKDYEKASDSFKRALNEDPKSIRGSVEKAKCEMTAGSFRTASSTLQRALKLSPNSAQLWYDYGFALYKQGKQGSAVEALKRSIQIRENTDNHYMMAQVLLGMKKKQEASQHLRKALKLDPENQKARKLLKSFN